MPTVRFGMRNNPFLSLKIVLFLMPFQCLRTDCSWLRPFLALTNSADKWWHDISSTIGVWGKYMPHTLIDLRQALGFDLLLISHGNWLKNHLLISLIILSSIPSRVSMFCLRVIISSLWTSIVLWSFTSWSSCSFTYKQKKREEIVSKPDDSLNHEWVRIMFGTTCWKN